MNTEYSESDMDFFYRSNLIIEGIDAISISIGPSIADLEKNEITECPKCKTFPKFELFSPTELKYECLCNKPITDNNSAQKDKSQIINFKNFFENFIQKNIKEFCFNHQNIPSISYCKNCNKYFCIDCLNKHNSIEIDTSSHEITHSFQLIKTSCFNHNNELAFYYCLNCNLHLCSYCVKQHQMQNPKHNFCNLKEIIKENTFQNLYSIFILGKKKIKEHNQNLKERLLENINLKINEQISTLNKKKNFYIKQLEIAYNKSKEINENLLKFYNILLNNYSSTFSNPNYNSIYNLQNIQVNLEKCDYESKEDIDFNFQKIMKYFQTNFILKKGKVQFNDLESLLQNDYPSEMNCVNTLLINHNDDCSIYYANKSHDQDELLVSDNESLNIPFDSSISFKKLKMENTNKVKINSIVSLTNKKLFACLNNGILQIYNYNKESIEFEKELKIHDDSITSISIIKTPRATGNSLIKLDSNSSNSDYFFSKNFIITSSNDNTIKLFDIENLNNIFTINYKDKVNKVFQLKDLTILANSSSGKLCLFNGSNPYNLLKKLESPNYNSNFIELFDGRIAICGSNTFQIISLKNNNNSNIIKNIYCEGPNSMVEISKRKVLVGSKGKIFIIGIDNCSIDKRIEDSNLGIVLSMIVLLDGSLLVGDNGGNLFRFNQTFYFMTMMEDCHLSGVTDMCINHLGNVITCSEEIRQWNY